MCSDNRDLDNGLHESEEIFVIKDQWKREYHFKVEYFETPDVIGLEAVQVKDDGSQGHVYCVVADVDNCTFLH